MAAHAFVADYTVSSERVALETLIGTTPPLLCRFKREFRALADLANRNSTRMTTRPPGLLSSGCGSSMNNLLFLALEFGLVSVALLGTYSLRSRLGLGPVVAVVASLQFYQALLGASLYWPVGSALLVSPGSCVLFAGNLAIVVYVFARDGVLPARTILYGILLANAVNIALNFTVAAHVAASPPVRFLEVPAELFDRGLVASLVGITVLYVDQVLALVGFAWLRRHAAWLPIPAAMALVLSVVLAFDTVGYLLPLFWDTPEFAAMLRSGLIAKGVGGLAFGLVWGLLLTRRPVQGDDRVGELLGVLLFREDLSTLRRAAITDEMTGLYNRRSYRLIFDRLLDKARSSAEGFALLVIDADRFKQVNDRLGHHTGDEVILAIAAAIRAATRADDFCFRLGGDEFAVLLPACDERGAEEVAERVVRFEFTHPELPDPVTLTIGLASFPADGDTAQALFEVADRRLYRGKDLGRGQVVSQHPD